MQLGLFGKLPAKRDFIAHAVDRAFLELWEPWMPAAIAASRDQLRDAWLPAYMNAPIWRFWLGADICGETVAGAVMPSVDEVGRYFPLSLVAKGIDMAPPELDAQAGWFDAAENVLLDALDEGRPFDTTLAALAGLPPPALPVPHSVEAALAAIRHDAEPGFHASLSCWWVRPMAGVELRAMIRRGMPGPYDFVEMIRPVAPPPAPPEPEPEPEPEPAPLMLTGSQMQAAAAVAGAGIWDGNLRAKDETPAAEEAAPPPESGAPADAAPPDAPPPDAPEKAAGEGTGDESPSAPAPGDSDTPAAAEDPAPGAESAGKPGDKPDNEPDDTEEAAGTFVLRRDMAVKADV